MRRLHVHSGRTGVPAVIRIDGETGRITVTVPTPDTGQGVRTAVAMMVAEELKVPIGTLEIEQANGDPDTYGPQIVANSWTIRRLHEPMRTAAATDQHADLVAVVARPPWIGAVPAGCDTTKVRNAEVVPLDNGFALVAGDIYTAIKARNDLGTTWQGGTPDADSDVWLEELKAALPEGNREKGR